MSVEKNNLKMQEAKESILKFMFNLSSASDFTKEIEVVFEKISTAYHINAIRMQGIRNRRYSMRTLFDYGFKHDAGDESAACVYEELNWKTATKELKNHSVLFHVRRDNPLKVLLGNVHLNKMEYLYQVPIIYKGKFVATMDFFRSEPVLFDVEEMKDLEELGRMLGLQLYAMSNLANCIDGLAFSRDTLTGFAKYENFLVDIQNEIAEWNKDSVIMIVYSDIHHFKYINETYGYKKGDELLMTYGRIIRENPNFVSACRVHSDNFVVVYNYPIEERDYLVENIEIENIKIIRELQKYCTEVSISINTGIYYLEDDSVDVATAIAHANLARKTAKKIKGRRCIEFNLEMMNEIKHQEFLNHELPKAIKNHNLMVYYQPKIDCRTEQLSGAEALIRWRKEDGTFIYPDEFIPVFEQNGNIIDVDYFVYREVFAYIRKRLDLHLPVVRISMNVSRIHLQDSKIIGYIRVLLDHYKVPTDLIEFELTENIYIKNLESAQIFIGFCKNMGINIAMDDFGSGYSSLNVMSSLPIDILKIDKIFLKNEELTGNDKIILKSVIDMAKQLDIMVLCEGVETKSQSEFLKEIKCDLIQGYYYGRPMSEENFDEYIIEHYN